MNHTMSHALQARRLKDHIASLETMTRFVLATLALASGVYTYLGVRGLLADSYGIITVFYFITFTIVLANLMVFFMPQGSGAAPAKA